MMRCVDQYLISSLLPKGAHGSLVPRPIPSFFNVSSWKMGGFSVSRWKQEEFLVFSMFHTENGGFFFSFFSLKHWKNWPRDEAMLMGLLILNSLYNKCSWSIVIIIYFLVEYNALSLQCSCSQPCADSYNSWRVHGSASSLRIYEFLPPFHWTQL